MFGWPGHSLLAVAIAPVYSTSFAVVAGNDQLAAWGVLTGALHAVPGGVVAGAWSDLHPDVPHRTPARRASSTGTTAVATF